jgi:hypothetical protein
VPPLSGPPRQSSDGPHSPLAARACSRTLLDRRESPSVGRSRIARTSHTKCACGVRRSDSPSLSTSVQQPWIETVLTRRLPDLKRFALGLKQDMAGWAALESPTVTGLQRGT